MTVGIQVDVDWRYAV